MRVCSGRGGLRLRGRSGGRFEGGRDRACGAETPRKPDLDAHGVLRELQNFDGHWQGTLACKTSERGFCWQA